MPKSKQLFKLFMVNFLSRHRNNANRLLHIIGIPLVILGIFQLSRSLWKIGLFNFFLGYLFQLVGHAYFEKSEVGEWILIRKLIKWLGRCPKCLI